MVADLLWASDPFISVIFSIAGRDCLFYAYPTIVFWKQITWFSSAMGLLRERTFGSQWTIPRVLPRSDIDDA